VSRVERETLQVATVAHKCMRRCGNGSEVGVGGLLLCVEARKMRYEMAG